MPTTTPQSLSLIFNLCESLACLACNKGADAHFGAGGICEMLLALFCPEFVSDNAIWDYVYFKISVLSVANVGKKSTENV